MRTQGKKQAGIGFFSVPDGFGAWRILPFCKKKYSLWLNVLTEYCLLFNRLKNDTYFILAFGNDNPITFDSAKPYLRRLDK
jgi:hypothetical protein